MDAGATRGAVAREKSGADLLFLIGLLVGGPVMTVGDRFELGLFIVLAGGLASLLRRYTRGSLMGSVTLGMLGAALVAVIVSDPSETVDSIDVGPEARAAYINELADRYAAEGGRVEGRGPGLVTVWFFLPDEGDRACGTVPEQEVREHLGALGFARVVVADRSEAGSVCSFEP